MDDSKSSVEDLEDIEEPTEYDESTWGKNVDGEYIIDGFKFKGKQSFKLARKNTKHLAHI